MGEKKKGKGKIKMGKSSEFLILIFINFLFFSQTSTIIYKYERILLRYILTYSRSMLAKQIEEGKLINEFGGIYAPDKIQYFNALSPVSNNSVKSMVLQ